MRLRRRGRHLGARSHPVVRHAIDLDVVNERRGELVDIVVGFVTRRGKRGVRRAAPSSLVQRRRAALAHPGPIVCARSSETNATGGTCHLRRI